MNRKEFCAFFEIPYRTVTDWELDRRHAPDYVLRLLEYYIRHEQLDTHKCLQKSFASSSDELWNMNYVT